MDEPRPCWVQGDPDGNICDIPCGSGCLALPDALDEDEDPDEWEHCSPGLLTAGVDCATTPRRPCECPTDGSHDHLVCR
jgi:hypothetical protein